jgi:glyoxylate carboligase
VVEGLGCKALRVTDPEEIQPALRRPGWMAGVHQVPVVVEIILERVTNIAMGTEIDNVNRVRGHRLPPPARQAGPDRPALLEEAMPRLPPT